MSSCNVQDRHLFLYRCSVDESCLLAQLDHCRQAPCFDRADRREGPHPTSQGVQGPQLPGLCAREALKGIHSAAILVSHKEEIHSADLPWCYQT